MEAYFDNSATTRCSMGAKDIMVRALVEDYGNPSSLHGKGMQGERFVRRSKPRSRS